MAAAPRGQIMAVITTQILLIVIRRDPGKHTGFKNRPACQRVRTLRLLSPVRQVPHQSEAVGELLKAHNTSRLIFMRDEPTKICDGVMLPPQMKSELLISGEDGHDPSAKTTLTLELSGLSVRGLLLLIGGERVNVALKDALPPTNITGNK